MKINPNDKNKLNNNTDNDNLQNNKNNNNLHNNRLITVSFGSFIDMGELNNIASFPHRLNNFNVPDYSQYLLYAGRILQATCDGRLNISTTIILIFGLLFYYYIIFILLFLLHHLYKHHCIATYIFNHRHKWMLDQSLPQQRPMLQQLWLLLLPMSPILCWPQLCLQLVWWGSWWNNYECCQYSSSI